MTQPTDQTLLSTFKTYLRFPYQGTPDNNYNTYAFSPENPILKIYEKANWGETATETSFQIVSKDQQKLTNYLFIEQTIQPPIAAQGKNISTIDFEKNLENFVIDVSLALIGSTPITKQTLQEFKSKYIKENKDKSDPYETILNCFTDTNNRSPFIKGHINNDIADTDTGRVWTGLRVYLAFLAIDISIPSDGVIYIYSERIRTISKIIFAACLADKLITPTTTNNQETNQPLVEILRWISFEINKLKTLTETNNTNIDDMSLEDIYEYNKVNSEKKVELEEKALKLRKTLRDARDNIESTSLGNDYVLKIRKWSKVWFYVWLAFLALQASSLASCWWFGQESLFVIVCSVYIVVPACFEAYYMSRGLMSSVSSWKPEVNV